MRKVMVFVLGAALLVSAAYAEDFSADMVSTSSGGSFTAKLYVSGAKSRMEMPGATTITDMDKKVMYMLMPADKMYMEHPIDLRTAASTQEKIEGEIERKSEGSETIDGINTTKYLVTFEANGARESIYQWIDEFRHMPVKTAAIDGSWSSEFKNIQFGPQDQAFFEIPDGYSRMALPDMSAMMGAMGEAHE